MQSKILKRNPQTIRCRTNEPALPRKRQLPPHGRQTESWLAHYCKYHLPACWKLFIRWFPPQWRKDCLFVRTLNWLLKIIINPSPSDGAAAALFCLFSPAYSLPIDVEQRGAQGRIPVGTEPWSSERQSGPVPQTLSWGFFENPSEQQRARPRPSLYFQLTCVPSRRMKNLCRYVSVSGRVRFRSPICIQEQASK